jgi:hypothetical protein
MSLERFRKKSLLLPIILIILVFTFVIWWVYKSIKEYHLQDDPMIWKLKEIIEPLHPEAKNIKLYKGNKSYTINKDKIYICLKDENDEYYPTNMLVYVLIHELAHKLNKDDIGHTPKFHQVFEDLLGKAQSLGIYNPSIPPVKNYCGHN